MADRVVIYLNGSGARQGVAPSEAILVGGVKRGSAFITIDGSNRIDLNGAQVRSTATGDVILNAGGDVTATAVGNLTLSGATIIASNKLLTNSDATLAAVKIGDFAGDPSTLVDGDIWYNSTLAKFRKRENGATSNLNSSEAATFVVHPTAGVGDFTTIQAAVNALPAAGGLILVREGTYSISSAIALPDKSITIRGVNQQSVIIDIGSNAIYAFTFLNTAAAYRTVHLENFSVVGDGTINQKGVHLNDPSFNTELIVSDVQIYNVDIGIYDEGCSGIELYEAAIYLADRDGVMHYDSTAALGSTIWLDNCFFENVNGAKKRGGIGGGAFVNISNSRLDCGTGTTFGRAQVTGSRFAADGTFTGTKKVSMGDTRGAEMSSCEFRGGGYLELATGPCTVHGCIFRDSPTTALDVLLAVTKAAISGCGFTFGTSAVRVAGSNVVVSGNQNCLVLETGAANNNQYTEILSTSTILGVGSTVEGVRRFDGTGSTTGSFVTVFTHTNPKGVMGIGTIDNTGVTAGFAMQVKETVIDAFGITASVTTTVAAGDTYLLDPQTNFATARPPYKSYKVEVKHPVSSTTYEVHHATGGAQ